MSLHFYPSCHMSMIPMSHVDLKKCPCRCVDLGVKGHYNNGAGSLLQVLLSSSAFSTFYLMKALLPTTARVTWCTQGHVLCLSYSIHFWKCRGNGVLGGYRAGERQLTRAFFFFIFLFFNPIAPFTRDGYSDFTCLCSSGRHLEKEDMYSYHKWRRYIL